MSDIEITDPYVGHGFPPLCIPSRAGFIYFIKPVDAEGPIKIGFTENVAKRFAAIQSCSPLPLELIGYFAGEGRHETILHRLFREQRSHLEWFHPSPELVAFAQQHSGALTGDVHQAAPVEEGPELALVRRYDREVEKANIARNMPQRKARANTVERQRPFRGPATKKR